MFKFGQNQPIDDLKTGSEPLGVNSMLLKSKDWKQYILFSTYLGMLRKLKDRELTKSLNSLGDVKKEDVTRSEMNLLKVWA